MKHIINYGLKFMGVIFFIIALGFTGLQTYSLIYEISGENFMTAMLGLIMFEFAMIYWWFQFQYSADGIPQLALSLLLTISALVFVLGATALKMGAVSMEAFGDNTANMLVTAAVLTNVSAKLLYPLLSQDMMEEIWGKAVAGMWMLKAFKAAERTSDDQVKALAAQLGDHLFETKQQQLMTKYGLSPISLPKPSTAVDTPLTIDHDDIPDAEAYAYAATPPAQEEAFTLSEDAEGRRGLTKDEFMGMVSSLFEVESNPEENVTPTDEDTPLS